MGVTCSARPILDDQRAPHHPCAFTGDGPAGPGRPHPRPPAPCPAGRPPSCSPFAPGDLVILNDPPRRHPPPDITLVSPIYLRPAICQTTQHLPRAARGYHLPITPIFSLRRVRITRSARRRPAPALSTEIIKIPHHPPLAGSGRAQWRRVGSDLEQRAHTGRARATWREWLPTRWASGASARSWPWVDAGGLLPRRSSFHLSASQRADQPAARPLRLHRLCGGAIARTCRARGDLNGDARCRLQRHGPAGQPECSPAIEPPPCAALPGRDGGAGAADVPGERAGAFAPPTCKRAAGSSVDARRPHTGRRQRETAARRVVWRAGPGRAGAAASSENRTISPLAGCSRAPASPLHIMRPWAAARARGRRP